MVVSEGVAIIAKVIGCVFEIGNQYHMNSDKKSLLSTKNRQAFFEMIEI